VINHGRHGEARKGIENGEWRIENGGWGAEGKRPYDGDEGAK